MSAHDHSLDRMVPNVPDGLILVLGLLLGIPALAAYGLGVVQLVEWLSLQRVAMGFAALATFWLFIISIVWAIAKIRARNNAASPTVHELAFAQAAAAKLRAENVELRNRLDSMIVRSASYT